VGRYQRIGGGEALKEILNLCTLPDEGDYGDWLYQEVSEFDAKDCYAFEKREVA
jgi:hypothetical protein